MNRKIILLPLASFLVLGLGGCGNTSSSAAGTSASSAPAPSSSSLISSSDPGPITVAPNPIATVTQEGDYMVKAVVVATNANSILLDDGTGRISYYNKGNCGDYKIGDYLKVAQKIGSSNYRYGNFQFTSDATVTQLDPIKAPTVATAPEAVYTAGSFDKWFTSMNADKEYTQGKTAIKGTSPKMRPYVSMRVSAFASGDYVNWSLAGSDNSGSFTLPNGITAEAGKTYDVTGYLYEVVSNRYAYLWVKTAEEYIPDVKVTAADGVTTIKPEGTVQLSAALKDTSATVASWASSDDTIATVTATGLVTGVKDGVATITATDSNGKTGTIDITVSSVVKLSDVLALEKGNTFVTRAVYMGQNNLENGAAYKGVYVADGETWYQLYSVASNLIPADLVAGTTVLEISGTVANYVNSGFTTYEATVTSLSIVTDASVTAGTWTALADGYALVNADVNKGFSVANGIVQEVSTNSYGNYTIKFVIGEGTTVYTLYLDSRYTDVTGTAFTGLVAGSTIACKTFESKGDFIYAIDFAASAPVDPTAITIQGASAATEVEAGKTLAMEVATVAPANGDRAVTWAVANKDTAVTDPLATIDSATGVLTAGATTGVVVVTATSTKVASVTGSVEITITASSGSIDKVSAIAGTSFTASGNTATYVDSPVTFLLEKNESTTDLRLTDADHLRVYAHAKFTVSITGGTVSSIAYTVQYASYAAPLAESTFTNATATVSGTVITATASSGATSVSFVPGAQVRLTSITVTYVPVA
ncbi:MAG: Ig-like domain-containing protein [Bacilli bacterium]|jgi:uncharacterized protein YjdB|nr:Ig-like domain-containing protein [Bacilli bacterium]